MKAPRILVVGSSNTDMIVRLPRLPRPGETLLGGDFLTAAGGKGANQAVAAARAGGEVTLIARVGADSFGDRAVAGLAQDRIRTSHVTRDRRYPSGVALIFVGADGQNSIAVAPGANRRLGLADIMAAEPAFARTGVLLVQLEIPLASVAAAIRLAARYRVPVILNPAPAQILPDSILRGVSLLTPNESEAELLTGIRVRSAAAAGRAARRLRARGARAVAITRGEHAVLLCDESGEHFVSAFKVKAVDTTAAGDVFNGALAVAIGEGKELMKAMQFASAAAAISVTKPGAQPSAPDRTTIDRFLSRRLQ